MHSHQDLTCRFISEEPSVSFWSPSCSSNKLFMGTHLCQSCKVATCYPVWLTSFLPHTFLLRDLSSFYRTENVHPLLPASHWEHIFVWFNVLIIAPRGLCPQVHLVAPIRTSTVRNKNKVRSRRVASSRIMALDES